MPLNNDFLGIYKTLKINNKRVAATSFTRNLQMETASNSLLVGTQKTKILNIGGVSESLTLNTNILIGSGSSVDGRSFANTKILEILDIETSKLPLMNSLDYSIGSDSCTVSVGLESDGNPSDTSIFEIRSDDIPELDPANGETRLAKFYDFRVRIGKRECFILSGSINFKIDLDKKYFIIPGYWSDYRGWGDPNLAGLASTNTAIGSTNITISGNGVTYQTGTQFPFFGIGALTVSGNGKAAVFLENLTDNGGTGSSTFFDDGETTNLSLKANTTDLTLQDPGIIRYENLDLKFDIFDQAYYDAYPAGLGWTSLFPPILDLSKCVVHTSNFSLNPGMMTVDFNFTSWID